MNLATIYVSRYVRGSLRKRTRNGFLDIRVLVPPQMISVISEFCRN